MGTTTNEIGDGLRKRALEEIKPFLVSLARAGKTQDEIVRIAKQAIETRVRFYARKTDALPIGDVVAKILDLPKRTESRAEDIAYRFLSEAGIAFKSQYPIGPYRVDFLIAGSIVLEIDGPHHGATKEYDAIRDTYLMRLGYRILRIPVWVLVSDPSAIVDEIEFELTKTVRNPRYRLGQREAYKEEARELLGEILSRR